MPKFHYIFVLFTKSFLLMSGMSLAYDVNIQFSFLEVMDPSSVSNSDVSSALEVFGAASDNIFVVNAHPISP